MTDPMVFCRACGSKIPEAASTCSNCGAPQTTFAEKSNDNSTAKYLLPTGRSGWAISAGYLALFSVLVLPAPFALFCGVMGLRDIEKNPTKLGKGRAWFGIIMGLLVLLTISVFTVFR